MDYRVVRSKRKTLSIEVSPDAEVVVRAPRALPDAYIARFVQSRESWLQNALAKQAARREAHPEPSETQAAALRAEAKRVLPEKVRQFAPLVGVSPTRITITGAKTRFGSCSGKNSISFSWRLMLYPEAAIDYVVVHELCHILQHNHSPAFYACVARVLPDWRKRRALLR